MALNNAQIYSVHEKIQYLNKDFLKLDKEKDFLTPPEVVFVSPPWGGVNYSKDEIYDLGKIKPKFENIIEKCLSLANNLVLFLPRNADMGQLANIFLQYEKLFSYNRNKECIITLEALIYGGHNIKALLLLIGPMFTPKTQEIIPRIKALFKKQFDPYESIIVQNIMKSKTVAECYEKALETIKEKNCEPKDYIAKLKELFPENEWQIVKKLHKKPAKIVDEYLKTGKITEKQAQNIENLQKTNPIIKSEEKSSQNEKIILSGKRPEPEKNNISGS